MEWIVTSKMRFDQAVALGFDVSRNKAQKAIQEGRAVVNGMMKPCSFQVVEGDCISFEKEELEENTIYKENISLDVVYEDDYLLVINKPSGMVVHPAPGHVKGTLVNALSYHFSLSHQDSLRPGIVHRLDKDTSGLMLVAKDDKTHELLASMIAKKEVERIYLAIVCGVISHETGTIQAPIGRDIKDREKMAVTSKNAKEAVTHFKVLERFSKHTLIACRLETGRTHQIRVHLAYIGYPVLNDSVYGKGKNATSFGQMLHSYQLSFTHPITKEVLHFEAKPPKEFLEQLEALRTTSDI